MMNELIGELFHEFDAIEGDIPADIMEDINAGFNEIDGCIVSKTYTGNKFDKTDTNETFIEADNSKTHIGDSSKINSDTISLFEITKLGFAYANALRRSLISSKLDGPFRIYICSNAGPDIITSCNVRFHRLRAEQPPWLQDNLMIYDQPVATIDF